MKGYEMSIWNHGVAEIGRKMDISMDTLGFPVLLKDILKMSEGHITDCRPTGKVVPGTVDLVIKKIEEMKGRLIYKTSSDLYPYRIWIWDHGMVELEGSANYLTLTIASKYEKFVKELEDFTNPLFVSDVKQGQVYAIVKQYGNLALSSLGNAGMPLIESNYMPRVIEDYNFVIEDLNAVHPSGRIVIMEGEPGTGKTHLVRAMLLGVPDAMFVLVSPELVPQLAGPELLPLLLSNRRGTTGPIVLILEDADKCLVSRDEKNINSIQSLLNLGDGILGSMLDLRIIATTNAKKLEMEKAIMRPGRLSKALRVGALDKEVALNVLKNLVPDFNRSVYSDVWSKIDRDGLTLAEVYSFAREAGWSPDVRPKEDKIRKIKPFDYEEDEDFEDE